MTADPLPAEAPHFRTPTHEIPLHSRSVELGPLLARWEWEISSYQTGWGVLDLDWAEAKGRTEKVFSRMYRPRLNGATAQWPHVWWETLAGRCDGVIPWAKAWDKLLAKFAGTDRLVKINDYATGAQISLWQPRREVGGRLWTSHGGLAGHTTGIDRHGDAILQRDGKGNIVPIDTRWADENADFSNGPGILGWYPNDDDLSRPVDRAMSLCFMPEALAPSMAALPSAMSAVQAEAASWATAPACQREPRNDGLPGPMVSGLHVSWGGVEKAIDQVQDETGRDLDPRVFNLTVGMSSTPVQVSASEPKRPGFGAKGTLTGDDNRLVCARTTLPRDAITRLARLVTWNVHVPPHGLLNDVDIGTGPGPRNDFRYVP